VTDAVIWLQIYRTSKLAATVSWQRPVVGIHPEAVRFKVVWGIENLDQFGRDKPEVPVIRESRKHERKTRIEPNLTRRGRQKLPAPQAATTMSGGAAVLRISARLRVRNQRQDQDCPPAIADLSQPAARRASEAAA